MVGSVVIELELELSLWQLLPPAPSRYRSPPPPVPITAIQYFWPLASEVAGMLTVFQAPAVSEERVPLFISVPG